MKEIIQKLRFRGNGIVLNAPAQMEQEFAKLKCKTHLDSKGANADTLVFFSDMKGLRGFLKSALKLIEPDSVLWFAYPKGTSKIKTDINRDIIRVTAEEYGITTVAAISIDDTWSALRFRPVDKVGK